MDTAPVKQSVAKWMEELLGEGRYYVGLSPVIAAPYLFDSTVGGRAARVDMLQNSTIGIVAPPGTTSAAIKLATDLCGLLGANPMFVDLLEVDSLMAAVHLLPQALANSLSSITIGQPGWMEGKKLAGALFAQTSSAASIGDMPGAFLQAIQQNREPMNRLLDALINQLLDIRAAANEEATDVIENIKSAQSNRGQWLIQRESGDWQDSPAKSEIPNAKTELRRRLFGWREK
jgi:prephenate dehydrogenase